MDQDVNQIKYDFFIYKVELLSSTSLLMVLQYQSVLDSPLYTLDFWAWCVRIWFKSRDMVAFLF